MLWLATAARCYQHSAAGPWLVTLIAGSKRCSLLVGGRQWLFSIVIEVVVCVIQLDILLDVLCGLFDDTTKVQLISVLCSFLFYFQQSQVRGALLHLRMHVVFCTVQNTERSLHIRNSNRQCNKETHQHFRFRKNVTEFVVNNWRQLMGLLLAVLAAFRVEV